MQSTLQHCSSFWPPVSARSMNVICVFLIKLFLSYVQSDNIADEAIFGLRSDRRIRSTCSAPEHNEAYGECGKNIKKETSSAFIFTADEGPGPGAWPWLVSIGDRASWETSNVWNHKCGGSLITRQLVLTAGHCCIDDLVIKAGDGDLLSDVDDVGVQVVAVDSYTRHPNYKHNRRYFDIGVLKLACPVAFTRYVRPICAPKLSTRSRDNDIHLVVAGWGADSKNQVGKNLNQAYFQVYPEQYCDDKYLGQKGNELAVPFGFTNDLLCGGDNAGSEGVCHGDSGSPAVFFNATEKRYTIKAVVSGGLTCGTRNHPNIYVRIGNRQIHRWIVQQINKKIEKIGIPEVDKTCSVPESCEKKKNCESVQRKYSAIRQASTVKLRKKIVNELKSLVCNKKEKAFCCPQSVLGVREGSSGWSSWASWSPCTKSCGAGKKTRRRYCSGTGCSHTQQVQSPFCNTQKC